MTWRDTVAAWKSLETRRPVPWRIGVAGLLTGSLAMVLSQAGALPRTPGPVPPVLIGALGLLAVVFGRRVLWNDGEGRLRLPWRLVGFNLLVIGLGLAGRFAGLPLDQVGMLTSDTAGMLAAAASLFAVLTLACLVAVRLLDRRPVRELGIVPCPGFWGDFAFGLCVGALVMALVFGTELLLGWVQVVDIGRAADGATSFERGFLNMTLLFVGVGFYEELATRGYLLRTLAQGFVCRRVHGESVPGGAGNRDGGVRDAPGTAQATSPADYTSKSGTLTFNVGQTSQTLNITVKGDKNQELDETFVVNLSNPVGVSIGDGQGVGTIVNDDGAPTITIDDKSVVEGDTGSKNISFSVKLSGATYSTVTVQYQTADAGAGTGFAAAGPDYTAKTASLTFTPGQTSKTATVSVKGDLLPEGTEIFHVNLQNPVNASISDGQAVATVTDNE